jgi:circadian clock protein KaiB
MRRNGSVNGAERSERFSGRRERDRYVLRLYVTGMTARSVQAITSLRAVCEERLPGRYDLEVIDLYQQPERAHSEQIIAAPTLVKQLPLPERRLIGDLSDRRRVLVGLNLQTEPSE